MRQAIEICAGKGVMLVLWKTKEFQDAALAQLLFVQRKFNSRDIFFFGGGGIGKTICRRRQLYLVKKTKMMTKWYSKTTRSIPGDPDTRTPPSPLNRKKVLATLCYVKSIYITQRKR